TVPEAPAPSAAAFLVVLTAVVVLGPSRAALATLLATAALAVLAVAFGTLTRRIVVLLRSSRLRRALRTSASAGSAPTTPGRPAALVLSVGRRRLALLAGVLGARLSGARLVGLRAAHSGLLRSSVRTPFGVILFGFLLGLTTLGLGFAHAVERKRRFFGGHTSRAGGAAALRGRPRPLRLALALTNGGDDVAFAHARGAGDAQLRSEFAQLRNHHARQAAGPPLRGRARAVGLRRLLPRVRRCRRCSLGLHVAAQQIGVAHTCPS